MAPKKRKVDGTQKTLFSVGVSLKNSNNKEPTDEQPSSSNEQNDTKQKQRNFQTKWLYTFKWLQFNAETKLMTCELCLKCNRCNIFTKGCSNFKTSALLDHIKSNDHQTALVAPGLQTDLEKVKNVQHSSREKAAILALKSVYWLTKENIPLCKFRSFINFQKSVGVEDLSGLSVSAGISYDSDYAAHEFLQALSDCTESQTQKRLNDSPYVTVLCDESTDRTVTHRLVLYCQTVNSLTMQPATHYITNIKLDEGTGAAISSAIFEEMEKRGIQPDKILGLGTDGASAMTGRDKGTTGMMLRKNPHLVNVHCIAHRLALCTSQAAEGVPAMKTYQEIITSIFYYFKYSTNRVARLREIETVLESLLLKFKEVHSVRWMSFYQALEAVYRCLDPLLTYLAEAEHSDAKAQGLKKKVGTLKFISLTYILMDIIPIVAKLNMFFQKEVTDVAMVKVQIDHTLDDLKTLLKTEGEHQKGLNDIVTGDLYLEHHIARCPQTEISSAKEKFISALIENVTQRFPDTDLLSSFGILSMRPISFPSGVDLDNWGNDQLDVLLNHFGREQTHIWKENKVLQSKTSPPLVDVDAAKTEWKELKTLVKVQMYPRDSIFTLWRLISEFHRDMFPNMLKLAYLAITCPVNTAGCERGFSVQNQTLTPSRNRLSQETQDKLFRIKINGKQFEDFPYDQALKIWRDSTERKMFC